MNRKMVEDAKKRMTAAGHATWVVDGFEKWIKSAGRGWRRTGRRVFGVKFT